MENPVALLVERQNDISEGNGAAPLLPKFPSYTVCNLRGGVGKTSLVFNLSFLVDNLLVVDTCPQCNLTWFYDNNYANNNHVTTINDVISPYFMPGLGFASHVAKNIGATNNYFANKNSFYISSDQNLYQLPTKLSIALAQTMFANSIDQRDIIDKMLFCLRTEIDREKKETNTDKCLIDTSPFFSGATHLACHASDALIVPVRTDQQSINSLELLIYNLTNPSSDLLKFATSNKHIPKIQLIVLTHCGWSRKAKSKNQPDKQTRIYIQKVFDIISRNIYLFTTNIPANHLVLLDDFLDAGRMSSAKSMPIELLNPKDTITINRIKTTVNQSVTKIKNQLKYIHQCIW